MIYSLACCPPITTFYYLTLSTLVLWHWYVALAFLSKSFHENKWPIKTPQFSTSRIVSLCVTHLNNHSDICLVLCLLTCWLIGSLLNNPMLARLRRGPVLIVFCTSMLDFFSFYIPSLTDELPPDHQTCEKTIATRLILLQASCICEQAGCVLCPATDGWACYAGWNENKWERGEVMHRKFSWTQASWVIAAKL